MQRRRYESPINSGHDNNEHRLERVKGTTLKKEITLASLLQFFDTFNISQEFLYCR